MIDIPADTKRPEVFSRVQGVLDDLGLRIDTYDDTRPWGGYYVIVESQADLFIRTFFPHLGMDDFRGFKKLSPKILMVAPGKRLSWQYHHRRSEIWKVIGGSAVIAISDTDEEKEADETGPGMVIEIEQGQRHRLIGTGEWGVIAEIWRHTDPKNPSDENDIVRLKDDFGRHG
ncbi:phosphoheptose isomerase [Balneolales bacterium ANBcel1]|nr:phosphoheptose isomerase [Balneolales bacterium ANBcel1]